MERKTSSSSASFATTPSMPEWYPDLLASVSTHVSTGRRRAVASANQEVIMTYWAVGKEILDRQGEEGWGTKVIDRLSADLKRRFPDAKGFSPRNLKYMRALAAAWPDSAVVQRSAAQLPWRHNQYLLDKLNDQPTREWYAAAAIDQGWSRDVLALHIETRLHERSGRAITNFKIALPDEDSDLAQQATRDPYLFDFLSATETRRERDLERGLMDHVSRFLLELGEGFAFVGRQVGFTIGGEEFFCDLLFYHLRLRRYVVIELKAVAFEPGFTSQLGMYMALLAAVAGGRCAPAAYLRPRSTICWPIPMTSPPSACCCARPRMISWPSTRCEGIQRPSASPSGRPVSPLTCLRNSPSPCPALKPSRLSCQSWTSRAERESRRTIMTETEIIAFVSGLESVVAMTASAENGAPEVAWGDSFFYFDPDQDPANQRMPFATVVVSDYPGFDTESRLDREGIFRLNVAVGRAAYERLLGHSPAAHDEHHAMYDYTELDTLLPHPIYAGQGWISILNPGPRTAELAQRLLVEAHDLARGRWRRRQGRD